MSIIREYLPTLMLLGVFGLGALWVFFYADPRIRRFEEERKKAATAAPESHSKSSE